ncbi:hypothetical protein [Actinoplanes sp. NPDC051494]|uniref:hypothetical protein n=1 Tax=Actinoplanes sp. NPDC051494 TaxID=3363907 RepID=UPI003788E0CB
MTQTQPPKPGLRECRLYRFYVADPATGERVLGYIGETWQLPFERLMQHVRDQPWADTMLGWELDPVIYWGKDAVLAAEQAAVEAERPLYNYEWNRGNPLRIEIWRAKEQRWARDDAVGRPRWVPPVKKPRGAGMQPAPARQELIDWLIDWRPTPQQIKTGLWSSAWATTAGITWAYLDVVTLWQWRLTLALLAATVLLVWVRAGSPVTRKQRRRVRQRIHRHCLKRWRRW